MEFNRKIVKIEKIYNVVAFLVKDRSGSSTAVLESASLARVT